MEDLKKKDDFAKKEALTANIGNASKNKFSLIQRVIDVKELLRQGKVMLYTQ